MNRNDLNKYKALLEAKQEELAAGLRNRDDTGYMRRVVPGWEPPHW